MKKHNKDVLKATLFALIAIFIMIGAAGLLFAEHKKKIQKEQQKKAAIEALERVPTVTPTPVATATPTPEPTATVTPTPVITRAPAFVANDYMGTWYSKDGLVTLSIDDLTLKSVTFTFSQAGDNAGTKVSEASDTAKVAGNAAKLSFTDSWGNQVRGNMTFDQGRLYLRLNTASPAEGAGVTPKVDGVLTREKAASVTQVSSVTPADNTDKMDLSSRDYIFPDSNSRYLTDEDLSGYSSDQLELAKNEIYARHGRKFVTQRIADYFNSKSWYKGTVEPETFDADTSVFNEYEVANIQKIADTEGKLRSEGK